eukprot:Opistho-2@14819
MRGPVARWRTVVSGFLATDRSLGKSASRTKHGALGSSGTMRDDSGSTDHRGVPEAPGRVVTLVEMAEESTWGIAYRIHPSHVDEALAYLDFRERGGYTSDSALFHPKDAGVAPFKVLVYSATPHNPNYLGPCPLDEIARQIAVSVGPSGHNAEYLIQLADAMRGIAPEHGDDHLFELEAMVKAIMEAVQPTQ